MNSANADPIEPSTLWSRNPVVMQLLGISPVLAVSTTLANGIGLGVLTALATIPCFLTAALLPRIEAVTWRLLFYVLVIASYVSIIDLVTQLTFYPLYRSLGIYVPLICGNAALLYRMELYASHARPLAALQDSLKTALGFFWVIIIVSAFREWLSTGSLLSQLELLKPFPGGFTYASITDMPVTNLPITDMPINTEPTGSRFRFPLLQPGALILLGCLVALGNFLQAALSKSDLKNMTLEE